MRTMSLVVTGLLLSSCGPFLQKNANKNNDAPVAAEPIGVVEVQGVEQTGALALGGNLGVENEKLAVKLTAIGDPEDRSKPVDPSRVTIEVSAEGGDVGNCAVVRVGKDNPSPVDLLFLNDTTGSMSGTVKGIATSIDHFTETLGSSGLDARFSMYTYGDQFATKKKNGSALTGGAGDFEPIADLDPDERPYFAFGARTEFAKFLKELSAADTILGVGGRDGAENTLGALAYANDKAQWREAATRIVIAIGDSDAHQPDTWAKVYGEVEGNATFAPPKGDDLAAKLLGHATVHTIGRDDSWDKTFYNLKDLADKTGGAFMELSYDGDVDLAKLSLAEWLTSSFTGACDRTRKGEYTIVVKVTVKGVDEKTAAALMAPNRGNAESKLAPTISTPATGDAVSGTVTGTLRFKVVVK